MDGIKGKVAIVTGGTRGIGLGISKSLAQAHAKVLAVYRSNQGAADDARRALAELDGGCGILKADVGKPGEAKRVTDFAFEKLGSVDFLINNAGIFDFSFLDEMTDEFFDEMQRVNLKGTVSMMQAAILHMKKQRFGRIINASSISGHFADAGLIAYACSKAGVDITTRIASVELAPYGITVNAFAPGIVESDMTRPMIRDRGHLQLRQIPAGYFGKPEDVAGLVLFLCSDKASYITGEVIGVDGGMMKVQNPYRAIERAEESQ